MHVKDFTVFDYSITQATSSSPHRHNQMRGDLALDPDNIEDVYVIAFL